MADMEDENIKLGDKIEDSALELKGFEYCKLPTLARKLDISANQMREVIADLCETHEIRILEVGTRMQLVNVHDFRRALEEACEREIDTTVFAKLQVHDFFNRKKEGRD